MAISSSQFGNLGGAVEDLFGYFSAGARAKGNRFEAASYDKASEFALLNKRFTEESTAIKSVQEQRDTYTKVGAIESGVTGTGGALSGSALDILRQTTSQGALERAVAEQQGAITAHGYQVESERYREMANASRAAAEAQDRAGLGHLIGGAFKLGAAVLPLV